MELEKGQYVVATIDDKDCLIRVEASTTDTVEGYHEYGEEEERVSFDTSEIQAVLSDNPTPGRVYGATTERLVLVTETPEANKPIKWFFKPKKQARKAIHEAVDKAIQILDNKDLAFALDWFDIRVVFNKAKRLTSKSIIGTYSVKGGENPDLLTIKYHKDSEPDLVRLFLHEVGHGLWSRKLSLSLQQRWLEVFATRVSHSLLDRETIDSIVEDVLESGELYSNHENGDDVCNALYGAVQELYAIKPRELDFLLARESTIAHDMINHASKHISVPIFETERDMHLTEYANTNAQESFCEWFSLHLTGHATPKYLQKLAEKTMLSLTK